MNINLAGVEVATSLTEILNVAVSSYEELGLSIKNNTANALSAFQIVAKFSIDGPEVILASIAGDLSSPVWPLRRADALVTLAGNTTGKLFMNVAGIHTLILKATAGVATNVDIDAQVT